MNCQSCGMPIEAGPYCHHCVDDAGNLHAFAERFERMMQWTKREKPDLDQKVAEQQTLAYMATMPAWKDHPELKARLAT